MAIANALYHAWEKFWDAGGAILLSGVISAFCAMLFWTLRWLRGVKFSTGTDLFAVLVAADISVRIGTVQVWRLSQQPFAKLYGELALILGIFTIAMCWIVLGFDRRANYIYAEKERVSATSNPALRAVQATAAAWADENYRRCLIGTLTVRWLTATLHLFFISKTPRWEVVMHWLKGSSP